jgi:hypothetical protein
MVQRLVAYKKKYGHCNVPVNYKDDIRLGVWVANQRAQYRNRQQTTKAVHQCLSDERIQQLESIGFSWHLAGPLYRQQMQQQAYFPPRIDFGPIPF